MEDIFVGRLMTSDVITVSPETTVEAAADMLLGENIGSLVVTDEEGHLEGILTSTDFVRIVKNRDPKDDSTVGEHMTDEVVTVSAQDHIQDASDRIVTYKIHHLPVVDENDQVIGILSTRDLTAYLSDVQKPSPA